MEKVLEIKEDEKVKQPVAKKDQVIIKTVILKSIQKAVLLPKELTEEASTNLGAYMDGRSVHKCLTEEEIDEFGSEIFGISKNSPDFHKVIENAFCDYYIKLTGDEVKTFQIPIDSVTGKVIFKREYANDIMAYRHCLNHPKVATDSPDPSQHWAILVDKGEEKKREIEKFKYKREANRLLDELLAKGKESALNQVLRIYKHGIMVDRTIKIPDGLFDLDLDSANIQDKQLAIVSALEMDIEKFIEVCSDEYIEEKALIYELVSTNILELRGNAYFFNNAMLGGSLSDAITYILDKNNSKNVLAMKAMLDTEKKKSLR